MKRIIFHVDVNSAFLSWEAVSRLRAAKSDADVMTACTAKSDADVMTDAATPADADVMTDVEAGRERNADKTDLRQIPSIIGGDPESRRSIVLAKSIPAKKYGIVTGEPVFAAMRKCPNLVVARADFALYAEMSRAFKAICREFSPVVEEFSIDECFLDMSGMARMYDDPVLAAYKLKDRIRDELGFTVNVGVAPNKLLAKMASDFKKPDRVHTLFEDEVPEKMWPLDVGELFLCGRASARKLKNLHIDTIGKLAASDVGFIQALLGDKPGLQLWEFANGISDAQVDGSYHAPKSISNEITFEDDITSWESFDRALLHLADSVGSRVRKTGCGIKAGNLNGEQGEARKTNAGIKGCCVSVTIRGNDMRKHSHQKKLDAPTDSTSEILDMARKLARNLWDGKTPLRLIGLSLSELVAEGIPKESAGHCFGWDACPENSHHIGQSVQLSFFDELENEFEKEAANDENKRDSGNSCDLGKNMGQVNNLGPGNNPGPKNNRNPERDRKADEVVDKLRERYGDDIIKRGGMLNSGIKVRKK